MPNYTSTGRPPSRRTLDEDTRNYNEAVEKADRRKNGKRAKKRRS